MLLSSCSNIPAPSLISPSENRNVQQVSFGEEPTNYQKILKDYLINNLENSKTAKIEFINVPSKISIDHLGSNYVGYRVCLSVNQKRGEHYLGYRNHFFLISNSKVSLHLYDSGLLTIPFEYCVSRNIQKELFVDQIPDTQEEVSIDSMDTIKLTSKEMIEYKKLETEIEKLKQENRDLKKIDQNKLNSEEKEIKSLAKIESNKDIDITNDNIYILCSFDDNENTYIFNTNKKTFDLIDKLNIIPYSLSYNEAYIVASNEAIELTINRVSGKAVLENVVRINGMCKLTNKTQF
tara:strand:- start:261 stop:1139 length:879 start_codon:yes stop_codon:yes gene_type:complete